MKCGYSLTGTPRDELCPECGVAAAASRVAARRRERRSLHGRAWTWTGAASAINLVAAVVVIQIMRSGTPEVLFKYLVIQLLVLALFSGLAAICGARARISAATILAMIGAFAAVAIICMFLAIMEFGAIIANC